MCSERNHIHLVFAQCSEQIHMVGAVAVYSFTSEVWGPALGRWSHTGWYPWHWSWDHHMLQHAVALLHVGLGCCHILR